MKNRGMFSHSKHSSTSKIGSRSAKLRRQIRRAIKRGERIEARKTEG